MLTPDHFQVSEMNMNSKSAEAAKAKRPYRQGARAEAAARTGDAIVKAFTDFLATEWYDDISLDRLAKASNVTVPTILRHFGNKEGVLHAVGERFQIEALERRKVTPGDIDGAIGVVVEDYEIGGDMVMQFLNQEARIPGIQAITSVGRMGHRTWVREIFAPYLDGLSPEEEEWTLDGLIVSLDLYVWKVLRRDRGRSPDDVKRFMRSLIRGIIGS